ncbi:hypothetical protein GCM10022215_05150 [Nocardioides fonticola]|uniref:SurA-like protein n=1 Tax=Nocardioides fonticola TaxID=450363 RepID=A0ABP7XBW0_9ACTN
MRLRPVLALASAAVSLSVLVSGCGVSDATFEPGVAAKIGDRTISVQRVDDAVTPTCEALQANPQLIGQGFSGAQLRNIVLAQLALKDIADALATENGLDAEQIYTRNEETARGSITGVSDATAAKALPVFAASAYLNDVLDQVITAKLGATTDNQVRQAAANQLIADYQQKAGIETNPLFDPLDFTATGDEGTPQSLSVALSATAKAADAATPAPAAVGALPANQRCLPVAGAAPAS